MIRINPGRAWTARRARAQRGAALLMAMLTVALVATFATAALWQQWRGVEVETAERARVQSAWILTGALDWARLLLREDARPSGSRVDHLAEPWAVPLQEARLSSFLAADKNNNADTGPEVMEAFLSGQIIDQQSLLNVNNLVLGGKISEPDKMAFIRLFELLGLQASELEKMTENLRFATDASENARTAIPQAPIRPQKIEQLAWLGLSPATISALQPYVTLLPARVPVNLNTASAEVIYAIAPRLSMSDAHGLVSAREQAHFRSVAAVADLLGGTEKLPEGEGVDVKSQFFEVRSRLRLENLVVEERAVLRRVAGSFEVSVIQRERGIADPTALSRLAAKR
ncbi:MAG: type II secretion system minor pseudopilin GspK [Ramlibacter sp.]|nr:type II secretion system minor pseudopilin GspK [Ramlibacter sp.]